MRYLNRKRQTFNMTVVKIVEKLGGHTHNLDWSIVDYFWFTTKDPDGAATTIIKEQKGNKDE